MTLKASYDLQGGILPPSISMYADICPRHSILRIESLVRKALFYHVLYCLPAPVSLRVFCLIRYNVGLMGYYITCLNAYLGYYVVFSMPALAYFHTILYYCSHENAPVGGDNVVREG